MDAAATASALRDLVSRVPSLPLPGRGATADRFDCLAEQAAMDLSLGRVAEAHYDALAIIAEAGRPPPPPGTTYGVWATRSGRAPLVATAGPDGWRLDGTKAFSSGAAFLERALVTAEAADGYQLFDVGLATPGVSAVAGTWPAVGMAGSDSRTVTFDGVALAPDDAVGAPGFYLERPGFWHGAVGVGACWSGGARGLVDTLLAGLAPDPSTAVLADVGRAVTEVRAQQAVLRVAAAAIDGAPEDMGESAALQAQAARQAVHASCVQVLALVAAAGGARPLGHDPVQAQRAADLYVYLSQHHGGDDAAAVGRLARAGGPWR